MGVESFKVACGIPSIEKGRCALVAAAHGQGATIRRDSEYILDYDDAVLDVYLYGSEAVFQYALCNPPAATERLIALVNAVAAKLSSKVLVVADPASLPQQRRVYEPFEAELVDQAIRAVASIRRAEWVSSFGSKTLQVDCCTALLHFLVR